MERLGAESGINLNKYTVADNIDLLYVLQQMEEFHKLKYEKPPVLIRKIEGSNEDIHQAIKKTKK